MMFAENTVMDKRFMMNNGVMLPALGLSTYRSRSDPVVYNVIDHALDAGYRLFDTSPFYSNEGAIRNALANLLPKYRLDRHDIFIASKLITIDNIDYPTIRSSFQQTLSNLGMDYIDLYMVSSSIENTVGLREAWDELQTLQMEGYIASIGVANFSVEQLKEIMEDSVVPAVNQVEWHPFRRNDELYAFCKEHNIKIQSYSPFGTPFAKHKRLFENRIVKKLAAKYEVSPAQIILMWCLQQDIAVIPSTRDAMHIKQNIEFDLKLSHRDMMRVSWLAPNPNDSDIDL